MIFEYKVHSLPEEGAPGAFGTQRKHDIHTGIDLYCENGTMVYCCEAGTVVSILHFTGQHCDPPTPWWNDTMAVLVETRYGVMVYGEIEPYGLTVGQSLAVGQGIGRVTPVLKKDKGVTPTSMLHFELLCFGSVDGADAWIERDSPPWNLLDPRPFLETILNK